MVQSSFSFGAEALMFHPLPSKTAINTRKHLTKDMRHLVPTFLEPSA
jgi:hypothetical protein